MYTCRAVSRYFEPYVVDGIVNGLAIVTRRLSLRSRAIQTCYVRNYALVILFGAFLVVGYYVVGGR